MKLPEIIGIAGTNGSGKDTLADVRHERHGARKRSLSDILRIEATRLGLDHSRENLISISTAWSREFGAGALSLMTVRDFNKTRTSEETGLSVVSIRRPEEARVLQQVGAQIIWVDADREVRYERLAGANRGRAEDVISFEAFSEQEDRELYPESDDPSVINLMAVRALADVYITNEFDSKEEYEAYLIGRFKL